IFFSFFSILFSIRWDRHPIEEDTCSTWRPFRELRLILEVPHLHRVLLLRCILAVLVLPQVLGVQDRRFFQGYLRVLPLLEVQEVHGCLVFRWPSLHLFLSLRHLRSFHHLQELQLVPSIQADPGFHLCRAFHLILLLLSFLSFLAFQLIREVREGPLGTGSIPLLLTARMAQHPVHPLHPYQEDRTAIID
ncbi:hypothetical protein PMAYCL1PPCAC_29441, partial [Pristionchus mayeri]